MSGGPDPDLDRIRGLCVLSALADKDLVLIANPGGPEEMHPSHRSNTWTRPGST